MEGEGREGEGGGFNSLQSIVCVGMEVPCKPS